MEKRKMIDLFYPYVPEEAGKEVAATLKSRWIGQGPKVDLFEKEFEKLFNVKYVVSVNSGSAALETAYDLLDLQPGDDVISTPLSCSATNIPLLRKKVNIIWADINPKTLCLDRADVLSKITSKTKAIVNVHLGGIENNLGKMPVPVVADSCQALGVFSGDYHCFSWQAIKMLTTSDGGMIVLNNEEEYKKAKLMRWFGIDREKKKAANWQAYRERDMTFDISMIGYKRQMTDIAATLGLVGLKHYHEVLDYRKKLFNMYKTELSKVDGIEVVDNTNNLCWLATLLVERRDDFARLLFENSIDTNLVQVRNDLFKIFGGKRADLPQLASIEDKYISIPIGMHVSEEDAQYIINVIKRGW